MDTAELETLIERVFRPGSADQSMGFLIDLPDAAVPDNTTWRARREIAFDWFRRLSSSKRLPLRISFYLFRNTRSHNADLPSGAWHFFGEALPAIAEDLSLQGQVAFAEIFSSHHLFLALTEFSASAPLRIEARAHHFRAASMPGFTASMIPALRLDLTEVHRKVSVLKELLDRAVEAQLIFRVDGGEELPLKLDLRHRQAHASSGLLREPGTVGNLPSGEAFIVPYEGEIAGDLSQSHGFLPVQLEKEVVIYQIVENRAVAVVSEGPVSDAHKELLRHEPAFGNLAELGLGVLADFGLRPIGEDLLDEKLGLHLAFGRSDHFGGQTSPEHFSSPESVVHIDRIYLPEVQPRITVTRLTLCLNTGNTVTVMEHGKFVSLPMTEPEQYAAFEALLSACLNLDKHGELLVLYDEAFQPFKAALLHLIFDWKLLATFIEIPRDYQIALTEWSPNDDDDEEPVRLPPGIAACIDHSSAVIAAINGELATNRFRRALLQLASSEGRWAHIPGISSEVLQAVRFSPFETIKSDCELLAWTLGEARSARLTTFDSQGASYLLTMDLGGWDNEPLMSPGVLNPGSWGNIPPGETFCCPEEILVSGEVCIDGSYPGQILGPGEEIVLRFLDGKVQKWWSPVKNTDSPAIGFLESERREALRNNDHHWDTFAELGIGLNPAITTLTGNSLFDEKAAGTVHVAIGDNSFFGHNIKSSRHTDLVIRRPVLQLDRYEVLIGGQLQHATIHAWREQSRSRLAPIPFDKRIVLREAKVSEKDGHLWRQLRKGGRVGYVQMLDEHGSRALAILASHLIHAGGVFPEDLMKDHETILGLSTRELLGILSHYRALGFLD